MSWNGTKLLFSTFLGGKGADYCNNVTLDSQGRIYVIGVTASTDFPTTAGAIYTKFRGGANDAFIARLSEDGSSLQLGTYFGGNARENPQYGRIYRVLRGGAWYFKQKSAEASMRFIMRPDLRWNYVGFRCAKDA